MAVDTELAGSASGGGVLAVLLAGRIAATHRRARGRHLVPMAWCTLPQ